MQKTYPFIRFDELTTGFESPVLSLSKPEPFDELRTGRSNRINRIVLQAVRQEEIIGEIEVLMVRTRSRFITGKWPGQ